MDHNLASSIAGYLSIVCWLVVFTPQLWENYRRKSGDGLSMTFLVIWLAGDVFNLLGVIMQDLLFTMFILALYYTVADMGLIWQVIYYQQHQAVKEDILPSSSTTLLSGQHQQSSKYNAASSSNSSNSSTNTKHSTKNEKHMKLFNWVSAVSIVLVIVVSCYTYYNAHYNRTKHQGHRDGEQLNWLPQTMGWLSAVLYIGSRVPQIVKNWEHKSTEGLSFAMFICAVMGNVFFTLSIFLKSTNTNYLLINLSWIVGSCGTLVFDFIVSSNANAQHKRVSAQTN